MRCEFVPRDEHRAQAQAENGRRELWMSRACESQQRPDQLARTRAGGCVKANFVRRRHRHPKVVCRLFASLRARQPVARLSADRGRLWRLCLQRASAAARMKVSLGAANAVAVSGFKLARKLRQPKLQLIYFPVRARAESIRLILAYGGIECAQETVQSYFGADWADVKFRPDIPFSQLPLLVVDGRILAQSGAIVRYTAGLAGLIPAEPFLAAHCDSVFEASQVASDVSWTSGHCHHVRSPSLSALLYLHPQELGLGNPLVNVYRGEVFEAKRADYFAIFYGKVIMLRIRLNPVRSAPPAARPLPSLSRWSQLANLAKMLGTDRFFCGQKPTYCDFGVRLAHARLLYSRAPPTASPALFIHARQPFIRVS